MLVREDLRSTILRREIMDKEKKKKLETKGWKVGSVEEFLELTPEETAYIQLKLSLSKSLREQRQEKKLTQADLAKLLSSSQSRVAKMEAADPSVSVDLLIRSLLALGVSNKELAKIIASSEQPKAA
jgi:Helix-turn-helix.